MDQHVREDQAVLDMVDKPVRDDTVFVQDDSEYPVDPLDDFPEVNAFGSATALDEAEGKVRQVD